MDKASLGGIILALGGILAGLLLEGGKLGQILQPTAAMIVFGGTLGAVMLQFPLPVVLHAMRRFGSVFVSPTQNPQGDHSPAGAICAESAPGRHRLPRRRACRRSKIPS